MSKSTKPSSAPETVAPETDALIQATADQDQPGFEEALSELEELIEKIESGQVGLEACLEHYERGMKLIARCQGVLGKARQRIAKLQVNADGSLTPSASEGSSADSGDDDSNDPQ